MPEDQSQSPQNDPAPKKYVSEFAPSQEFSEKPVVQNVSPSSPSPEKNEANPTVVKPQTTSSSGEYASFGRRFVAGLLDGIILGIINTLISIPAGFLSATEGELAASSSIANSMVSAISLIIGLFYSLYFIGKKGQTPGKMALGIKVVKRDTNEPPGYVGAFLREYVGKFLSAIGLLLGYFWMLWDKDKQTWHDKIAGTVVYKIK